MKNIQRLLIVIALLFGVAAQAQVTETQAKERLKDFDAYMAKTMKDWNSVGIGVAVVVNDKVVFMKGYGYRDIEKKLPFDDKTLFAIASNTKLFTTVSAGMLVEDGKLTWDNPIRESVPEIRFYNDELNNSITLRDMLSHRTGVTRHDSIWYRSEFTRKELFEKMKYLEPQKPIRTEFLYNNLMYTSVGEIIELKTGKSWEEYVKQNIFTPLGMSSSSTNIKDLVNAADAGVAYDERRDSFEIYRVPFYEEQQGIGPAGAVVTNLDDASHWLIALMNEGKYEGKQVIPADVLKETLEPSIGFSNQGALDRKYLENLNGYYGMARFVSDYRGHILAMHGGDIDGFHSQISMMPTDHVGALVFVLGNHNAPLYNYITYNIYDKLLGLDLTPWTDRGLAIRLANKKAGTEARAKTSTDTVPNTKPSHELTDYIGEYEHPAYGVIKIGGDMDQLKFAFHKIPEFKLNHVHYDRFDTPNDEQYGTFSVNFETNPQGDVSGLTISLDEAAVTFTRKAPTLDDATGEKLAGTYLTPSNGKEHVVYVKGHGLTFDGDLNTLLIPMKALRFRDPHYPDLIYEFVMDGEKVTKILIHSPDGIFTLTREQ